MVFRHFSRWAESLFHIRSNGRIRRPGYLGVPNAPTLPLGLGRPGTQIKPALPIHSIHAAPLLPRLLKMICGLRATDSE